MDEVFVPQSLATSNMYNFDYIVVGAGFYGAVIAERIANDLNKNVLVIDKRDHVGGNCYSEIHEETKIEFHKYGTHIFHTSNETVWKYINRFTSFNGYYHQVLTTYNDKVYQMPINLETINSFYNVNLKPFEVDSFLSKERKKEFYKGPNNFEEQAINSVGRPLYEALLKGYSIKQWEREPKEIPASVVKRLPFRTNYSESYYFDTHQGIPIDGYATIFENMLASQNITLRLNTDFFKIKHGISDNSTIIYSGKIDRLFDYKYGDLEYRTLRFDHEVKDVPDYQGTSVMNYGNVEIPYTRIHEPKHLHPERTYDSKKTLIMKEYSSASAREEPYYPVGGAENQTLYNKYLEELKKHDNVIIGGRLGEYKYYDMHNVIASALTTYEDRIKKRRR